MRRDQRIAPKGLWAILNVSRALEIFGWMEPEELEWLGFEASRHSVIVEIGSYMGRSTRVLADNTAGVVYAVDNWEGPREIDTPIHKPEEILGGFRKNMDDVIHAGRVLPIKMESLRAAMAWKSSVRLPQPDMVFIDGSHDKQSVVDDLTAWSGILKRGGLLCGHDAQWEGVKQALRDLAPAYMMGIGQLWAIDNFQGLRG